MKIRDPLVNWKQPESIRAWGGGVKPPPDKPWLDYINYFVHPDIVSAVGRFLLPTFTEHQGGVFISDNFTIDAYDSWIEKISDTIEVEKIINHRHVYDMFSVNDHISENSYAMVAELMAETLRIALRFSFPDRQFDVYVSNSDQDYGPVVGFHSL